jgi:hypothetical protein
MLVTFPESKTNKDQRKKVNLPSKIAHFEVPLVTFPKVKKNKDQKKKYLPELLPLKNKEKGMLEAFLNEKKQKKTNNPLTISPIRTIPKSKRPFLQKRKKKNVRNVLTTPKSNSPTGFISKGSGSSMIPRSRSYKKEILK